MQIHTSNTMLIYLFTTTTQKSRLVTRGNKKVRVVFCDTDGQERFGTLTTALYKSLNGCVLVFSRTNPVRLPAFPSSKPHQSSQIFSSHAPTENS